MKAEWLVLPEPRFLHHPKSHSVVRCEIYIAEELEAANSQYIARPVR